MLARITVHGRFQPPLHVNHWDYIGEGFKRAKSVQLLITNPFINEDFDAAASWRSDPANNPFSYDERVEMFEAFFKRIHIDVDRYTIQPFNIKDDSAFSVLDPAVPNLVNVYSEWSSKKVDLFKAHGLQVIRLEMPKRRPVSGTRIRELILSTPNLDELPQKLIDEGFMPEAIPGLMEILKHK